MIGGIVVKVRHLPDRVWMNCEEERSSSQCAIFVERNAGSELIRPGDSFWWQGGNAMWTPYAMTLKKPCEHRHHYSCLKPNVDYDIRIPRIGSSGVKEPPQERLRKEML